MDWEDYLLAVLVTVGGLAQYVDQKGKWFIVLTGAGLLMKALKDIRDARKHARARKQP